MNRTSIRRARTGRIMRMTLLLTAVILILLMLPAKAGSTGGSIEITVTPVPTEAPTKQTEPADYGLDFAPLVDKATYEDEYTEPTELEQTVLEVVEYEKLYTEADVIALAKMAWGEALVTNSDTEIAATMWCVLNRFDCDNPYYRNCKTIEAIVKQGGAFFGYSSRNPEDEHLIWLASDVLDRWNAEQHGETDVGRILPADYLFFHGDGKHNHFRKEYKHDGHYWDWSMESPYET